MLCCGYTLTDFPISIRLTSLALWQSNDCPSASKATLMNMDKYFMWIHYERLHNHNKTKHNKTVCIFLGIYYTCLMRSIGLPHYRAILCSNYATQKQPMYLRNNYARWRSGWASITWHNDNCPIMRKLSATHSSCIHLYTIISKLIFFIYCNKQLWNKSKAVLGHTKHMLWEKRRWFLLLYMKTIPFKSKCCSCLFSNDNPLYWFFVWRN